MKTYKVVLNRRLAHNDLVMFGLSDMAKEMLSEATGKEITNETVTRMSRHNPQLVEVVETLGKLANGKFSTLKVQEVNGPYRIVSREGFEYIETPESVKWIDPESI